ncbi:MAG: hypothetical protein H8E03_00555 [Pelagibacteraceae bacterium]|nr:hypothetical protein [Pelagibacteraceae bacterium]
MIKLVYLLSEEVTNIQLNQVEKYLDKLWSHVGIDVEFTRHFMNRVNDNRNGKPISSAEIIRIFKQEYKKYGKQISKLGDKAEVLLRDMQTDINIPVALNWNGKELEMVAKTIMRKKNFSSRNKKFSIESKLNYTENSSNIKKIIAVYSGRFQPYHKGHHHAYEFLVKKFGKKNVFIATSNVTGDKSPFDFKEKETIISKMFNVPKSNIVQIKNPYNPVEIKSKFDEKTTALVVGLGEKDVGRLSGKYYTPYTVYKDMESFDTTGYVIPVPQLPLKINSKTISGTVVRNSFKGNDPRGTFKALYGKMNTSVYGIFRKKFGITEGVLTEGIKHIEDMKPKDLLNFLKLWNADNTKFEVNEKVDGHFFQFGINGGSFYSGSKTKTVKHEKDYPSLYFYTDFVKYHKLLKKIPYKKIVDKYAKKFGIEGNTKNISIECEAIPSWDYNIVLYDPEKIGDGIVVLFKIIVDGKETPIAFHEIFAKEANKKTSIKFFANPKVNLKQVHFEEKYEVLLSKLIEKYGNLLNTPARKPHHKKIKYQIQRIANLIGKKMKGKVLKVDFQRAFGEEDEGLVLYVPDGNVVKIVDKDQFTARKDRNWKYMNDLQNAERKLVKSIKSDPTKLSAYLSTLAKDVKLIAHAFNKDGDTLVTIPKKRSDTKNSIILTLNRIKNMRALLKKNKPEAVSQMYLDRKVD